MRTTTATWFALPVLLLASAAACGGSGGSSGSQGRSVAGDYAGHGAYINPINFSVSNNKVSDVHGLVSLNCVGAAGTLPSRNEEFADADQISVDSAGHFSDDYHYDVGNGTWTLHVEGSLAGGGTATGFLFVRGVGCSTPTDGWAAALPNVELPAIPTATPTTAGECDPQPCATQPGNTTIYVQSTAAVTASDDPSIQGIDITATFAAIGTNGVPIQTNDFELQFDNGDVAEPTGHYFVDSSGAQVPCIRPGSGPLVDPGQQVTDVQVCLTLTGDESGQQMTLKWGGLVGPPIVLPLGAAP